jgi:hypothetical protein
MSLPVAPGAPQATPETPVVESAPVTQAAPEAPKAKDDFAEKLEILAKRERALYREKQSLAQERQQKAELEARLKTYEEKKAKAKQNPLDYLTESGLSYDDITNFMLNGGKPTAQDELQAVRDEFKRFRDELADKEKKQSEQQTQAQAQQQTQVIEDFKEEITQFLATNKDTYELSASREATEDIFSTINDAFVISMNDWAKRGRQGRPPAPMAIKDAAEIVESFYEKEVLRLTETTKLRQKLGLADKQAEQSGQKPRGPSPTLTNNMASSAASVVPARDDADRMRRALEKLS